jgi:hypothetical protein
MADRTQFPQFLRRAQSCEYLLDVWGIEMSVHTLVKRCSQGRGPATSHFGRVALHSPASLDEFAQAHIKAHVRKAQRPALDVTALSTLSPIVPSGGEWRPSA